MYKQEVYDSSVQPHYSGRDPNLFESPSHKINKIF